MNPRRPGRTGFRYGSNRKAERVLRDSRPNTRTSTVVSVESGSHCEPRADTALLMQLDQPSRFGRIERGRSSTGIRDPDRRPPPRGRVRCCERPPSATASPGRYLMVADGFRVPEPGLARPLHRYRRASWPPNPVRGTLPLSTAPTCASGIETLRSVGIGGPSASRSVEPEQFGPSARTTREDRDVVREPPFANPLELRLRLQAYRRADADGEHGEPVSYSPVARGEVFDIPEYRSPALKRAVLAPRWRSG